MERYVFFSLRSAGSDDIQAITARVLARGGKVVTAMNDKLFIEADPLRVKVIAEALPGWFYRSEHPALRAVPAGSDVRQLH